MVNIDDNDPQLQAKQQLVALFLTWFSTDGEIIINDDLSLDVDGYVHAKRAPFPNGRLPVKFHTVKGFYVGRSGLTTFENSPVRVLGHAWFESNPLTSLAHAPQEVLGAFGIPDTKIENLDGLPAKITALYIDYHPHMPLLKALSAKQVMFNNKHGKFPTEVEDIINRYAGQGQSAALECAVELGAAGHKDNARW